MTDETRVVLVDAFQRQQTRVNWQPGMGAKDLLASAFKALKVPPPGATYEISKLFQVVAPDVTLYDPYWGILQPDRQLNNMPQDYPLHFYPASTVPDTLGLDDIPLGNGQALGDLAIVVIVQREQHLFPVLLPRELQANWLFPLIERQVGSGEIPALYNATTDRWLAADLEGQLPNMNLRYGDLLEIREADLTSQISIEDDAVDVILIDDEDLQTSSPTEASTHVTRFTVGRTVIEFVTGDIARQDTDVIVNAANEQLQGGGGVDGAIHQAAGPALKRASRLHAPLRAGRAVLTPGFRLRARWVIHAVGPVYRDGHSDEADMLASAYRKSMLIALHSQVTSIAFPSISTGAYGYPIDEAAQIAIQTIMEMLNAEPNTSLQLVRFVLFADQDFKVYKQAAQQLSEVGDA